MLTLIKCYLLTQLHLLLTLNMLVSPGFLAVNLCSKSNKNSELMLKVSNKDPRTKLI